MNASSPARRPRTTVVSGGRQSPEHGNDGVHACLPVQVPSSSGSAAPTATALWLPLICNCPKEVDAGKGGDAMGKREEGEL